MSDLTLRRLGVGDRDLARRTFHVMAEVFGEACASLSDAYTDEILGRTDVWVMAALRGDEPIGGITAYALPLTRTEGAELFIYDIAVHNDHQRAGLGRRLVAALRAAAAAEGIRDAFVAAESGDAHALDFYRSLGATATAVTFFAFSPPR